MSLPCIPTQSHPLSELLPLRHPYSHCHPSDLHLSIPDAMDVQMHYDDRIPEQDHLHAINAALRSVRANR